MSLRLTDEMCEELVQKFLERRDNRPYDTKDILKVRWRDKELWLSLSALRIGLPTVEPEKPTTPTNETT